MNYRHRDLGDPFARGKLGDLSRSRHSLTNIGFGLSSHHRVLKNTIPITTYLRRASMLEVCPSSVESCTTPAMSRQGKGNNDQYIPSSPQIQQTE